MLSIDTLKTINDTLLNEEHLMNIQKFTQETAFNTSFSFWREADFWEYLAISLSVVAILLAVITAISQWKTERNTRMSLSMKTQVYESIFKLLLNDLYRIQCDILSLQIILMENDFQSYPSERYLKNMIIKFDDSNLDSFLAVFNKKYRSEAEEHYLKMCDINYEIHKYNINIEMLMEHLKDVSIDVNTKLKDFHTIYYSILRLSKEIIHTTKIIYGKNSNIGDPSFSDYVKKALLEFCQPSPLDINYKADCVHLKKHESVIVPIINNYFSQTNITYTEDAKSLTYKLIYDEIEKSDSNVRRNLIKFKS